MKAKRIAALLGASLVVLLGTPSCETREREQPRPPARVPSAPRPATPAAPVPSAQAYFDRASAFDLFQLRAADIAMERGGPRAREFATESKRQHEAISAQLRRDRLHWELVDPTRPVLGRAEELAGRHGLRAMDALHVASAIEFETSVEIRIPFVTADQRQREAAERVGLNVLWVGAARSR